MSTNIESLPLLQANIGVGSDEDLVIALGFYLSDAATPLSLVGINFTAVITNLATGATVGTLTTAGGQIVISGASSNLLTITELASAKAAWTQGVYALDLTASDSTFTKDVFVSSSLTIGAPSPLNVVVLRAAGALALSIASSVPPIATAAVQAIISAFLIGLPTTEPASANQLWNNGGVLCIS